MLSRKQKEAEVESLHDKFSRATSVFVADYRGLDVKAVNVLRRKLREGTGEGVSFEYHVGKNSLLKRAVAGLEGVSELDEHFVGPTAYAISYGDPVLLARVLVDYARANDVFELKAGVIEGRAYGREDIATIATLPSLQEIRAQLVGLVQAPATKLVRLVLEPAAQLARLVKARQDSLGDSGEA